jgi:hypothetical protein
MSKKQRVKRKVITKRKVGKYELKDIQKAISIAIAMKKLSKGHLFTMQEKPTEEKPISDPHKARCVFCGATMKTKKECAYWAMTLFDRMQMVLINPDFFKDDDIQALWLQHGEEYQNVKLPLVFGVKDDKTT